MYFYCRYGNYSVFYRYKIRIGYFLFMFYVYDFYIIKFIIWVNLLIFFGFQSVRSFFYDGLFIVFLVEEKYKNDIFQSGFDGIYIYFVINGFIYGLFYQNWNNLKFFCEKNNLMFILSVGLGYIDISIRLWNIQNIRNRVNGKYYEVGLSVVFQIYFSLIFIIFFNEWYEGI